MNGKLRLSILLIGLVSLVPVGVNAGVERVETTIRLEQPLADGSRLSLENLLGSISIEGGGTSGLARIETRVVAEAKTSEEAQTLLDSVHLSTSAGTDGPFVRVVFPADQQTAYRWPKSESRGWIEKWIAPLVRRGGVGVEYDGRTVQIGGSKDAAALVAHVRVVLPISVSSSFRQAVGTIDCRRLRGDISLESMEGAVSAVQVYGRLQARTGDGTIEVKTFKGEHLDLGSVAGRIELVDLESGRTRVSSESGRVFGRAIRTDELTIETASGDVELEELEPGSITLSTDSGAVDLATRLKRTRVAAIESGSGNVTLRVGTLTSFRLDTRTETGSVRFVELPVETIRQDGGASSHRYRSGGTPLSISTGSGDVTVRAL